MVDFFDFSTYIEDLFALVVESSGVLGIFGSMLLLVAFMIIQAIIAPIISEGVLTAAGGVFYSAFGSMGILAGIVAGIIGSMLGAWIAFLIARWIQKQIQIRFIDSYKEAGKDISEIEAQGFLAKIAKFLARFIDEDSDDFIDIIEEKGFTFILVGRILPFIPFDAVSYAAGLTRIRFKDFMWATFIGTIPRVSFYIYLGTELGSRLSEGQFTSFMLLFAVSVIVIFGAYKLSMRYFKSQSSSTIHEDQPEN